MILAAWPAVCAGQETAPGAAKGSSTSTATTSWRYDQDVLPADGAATSPWYDVVLLPQVFDASQTELADLRLFDGAGREIPYDLRVRRSDYRTETIRTKEFNRARGPGGSAELTLDIGNPPLEHNEVQVQLAGSQYRRHSRLEGSPDGSDWRLLVEKDLFHFERGRDRLEDQTLPYPPSRFRFLRVRVDPDPVVDKSPVQIPVAKVLRRVEVPGETLTLPGRLGSREPVRTSSGPGSAWIIDLGGNTVPCDRIDCQIADAEFVRNYRIESAATADEDEAFRFIGDGVWRRGKWQDSKKLVVAEFGEVRARRLRLTVTDAGNPPLDLRSVTFSAAARQVVFPHTDTTTSAVLKLYTGDPKAYPPRYDFAGNLPPRLEPPPVRRALGSRQENPAYVPEPKPLSERWPWLIYVVLGTAAAVLGIMIVDLARQAIARHDAHHPTLPGEMSPP